MANRGIGFNGVVSEMGALCRKGPPFRVDYDELVESLCRRFQTTPQEAEDAIKWAQRVRVIIISHEADGRATCHLRMRRS